MNYKCKKTKRRKTFKIDTNVNRIGQKFILNKQLIDIKYNKYLFNL